MDSRPLQTPEADASISIRVDGALLACQRGQTVASALLTHSIYRFRSSPNGKAPRGPFCIMGSCQECAIRINGSIRRACQTDVEDGMTVDLRGAGAP